MIYFIELTASDNSPLILNMKRIVGFGRSSKNEDLTAIYVGGEAFPYYVKETVEEIKNIISEISEVEE